MIGAISPSVATAIRTAGEARERVDRASREIATGQKVASVKDDGAAWTRTAQLRSQQAAIQGRDTISAILESQSVVQLGELQGLRDLFMRARDVLLAAKALPAGSTSRTTLQNEFNAIIGSIDSSGIDAGVITSGYALQADGKWGVLASQADPVLNGRTVFVVAGVGGGYATGWISPSANVPFDFRNTNVTGGTDSHLDSAIWWANEFQRWVTLNESQAAGDQAWLGQVRQRDSETEARLGRAIGALTDADLGKASTARAQAETRQQLALNTVRQALDAYGAFAGGLLGNVQRTQRALA